MHIYLTILYVNIDLSTNTYIFIFITEMNAYIYKLFSVFLYMYVCMFFLRLCRLGRKFLNSYCMCLQKFFPFLFFNVRENFKIHLFFSFSV